MMNLPLAALLLAAVVPGNLPFAVDASEDASSQFPGAPRIQSFSFAQWEGRWVFLGGRKAGYHSVGGGTAEFLRSDANREVWVVDTTATPSRTYHASVDQLPQSLAVVRSQWASTAQLYFQDGPKLYIAGGYGEDGAGKWVTFPVISRVDLPQLIESVLHGKIAPASVSFAESKAVQSAGGGLIKLADGFFYLVMGHSFSGSYTAFEGQGEHNAEAASQVYLNQIRKLKIADLSPGRLDVSVVETFEDEDQFHRRDLNVTPILSTNGLGLAAYGGVFTPQTQLSYSQPVYLFESGKPLVDHAFDQKMNTYSCPTMLLYEKSGAISEARMYTTFFGGIGRFSWDAAAQKFVENPKVGSKTEPEYLDGLQWSDQISTIQRNTQAGKVETSEAVQPAGLPGFLGAGAVFIPVPQLKRAYPGTDILDLEPLRGTKTLVGYIYGGIRASPYRFPYDKTAAPNNSGAVPTVTNGLILKVYLDVPGK
jgi:hypothetical protein